MENQNDYIEETILNGVFVIKRPTFGDERGFFRETFRKAELEKRLGYAFEPKQANHSRSQKGSLRGIHIAPYNKFITVTRGLVQQVVVDTREDSKTFGQYVSIPLGEDNWYSVFIPAHCGNAFLVLSNTADYTYITTDYWSQGAEKYVVYNDPDIAIAWQSSNPTVSEKDLQNKPLKKVYPNKST